MPSGLWNFVAPYSTSLPANKSGTWIPKGYVYNRRVGGRRSPAVWLTGDRAIVQHMRYEALSAPSTQASPHHDDAFVNTLTDTDRYVREAARRPPDARQPPTLSR